MMETPLILRCISGLGLLAMLGLAWLLSEKRKAIPWRVVIWGMLLQFLIGVLILQTQAGPAFFNVVKSGFDIITQSANHGAEFLFGNLTKFFMVSEVIAPGTDGQMAPQENYPISAVFAFNVLPVIVFVSALSAILQHLGVIQAVVRAMAWVMRRSLRTSGAETFGAALLVFMGIESVSALGGYLQNMTRSEIFTLLVAFLATIAASVMVAYASFGAAPGHLMAASIMSAPAALVMAKLMIPETGRPESSGQEAIAIPVESHNIFDAAARGASQGLTMALNVGALLIVFVGLIFMINLGLEKVCGASLTQLLGYVFRPFAFLMGVPGSDVATVAELLATKSIFNEFLAYQHLQPLIADGQISKRAITITTYALCGFANPGSMGIMIGAMSTLAPGRRSEVAQLSLKAFIGGTLAAFSTACVAGILSLD